MPDPSDTPVPELSPVDKAESNPASAAALMVAGSALFVCLAALVKAASNEATPMQAVLYRSVFSGLPLAIVLRSRGIPVVSNRWGLLCLRGTAGFIALYCYLWAVSNIPLADVLALQQLSPIFVTFLSIVLLKERPRSWHYVLGAVSLAGAMLVVKPTQGVGSLGSLVALLSAVFSSVAYVFVRRLTATEPSMRIVFWFSSVAALLALPFVIPGWTWLSPRANLCLIGAGLVAALAQTLMTAAYRRAQAHVTSAFSYASVPIAYLTGLIFWNERPDRWSTMGIGLIVLGGVGVGLLARQRR